MAAEIYSKPGTAVTFASSGGDVAITCTSVANGAGRISAEWDRGSGSKPARYRVNANVKAAAALAVGTVFALYFAGKPASGLTYPGNISAGDAGLSSLDKTRNLTRIGVIEADSTSNGEVQAGSWEIEIRDRYVVLVVWNALGQALSGTAGDHVITFTPVPDEIQTAT